MDIRPYLSFEGRCEEAIEFYRGALGAEVVMLLRYSESPDACEGGMIAPGTENKVMHSTLRVGDATFMMADGHCSGQPKFEGISLSLTLTSETDAERFFERLSEGGQVELPLSKTFFSPKFGMVADRFGVRWMIYVPGSEA